MSVTREPAGGTDGGPRVLEQGEFGYDKLNHQDDQVRVTYGFGFGYGPLALPPYPLGVMPVEH